MSRRRVVRPHKAKGFWYLIRRVPTAYQHLDRRETVRISTEIAIADDPKGIKAKIVVEQLVAELEVYWRGLADGQAADARIRYEAARARARALGFTYMPVQELSAEPLEKLIKRFEFLIKRDALDDADEVAAVLGGEDKPHLKLSELFAEFEKLQAGTHADMSPNQIKKWRAPKQRALDNLISVIGDKPLDRINRNDALDFRVWWQSRVVARQLDLETANRDFGHIAKMWRVVDETHQLGLPPVFRNLRIEGTRKKQRTPYEPKFVQERILAADVFPQLNSEALGVLYLVADTGMRLSEACNLSENTIFLDAPVPYVEIAPEGRRMKTAQSERQIPLVGCALMAMKANPTGFPRYRDKAATLSALLNKTLGERGLRPTKKHSVYSLRHCFEDRLTAVEAPEKLIAALMGHEYSRPKYGFGPSLEQKQRWLKKIAFTLPGQSRALAN